MSILGTLLGLGSIAAPFIPGVGPAIGAGLGAASSLIGGAEANSAAKKASGQQGQIAQSQFGTYQQASPMYLQLLHELQQHAMQAQNPYGDPGMQGRMNQVNEGLGHQYHNAADNLSFGLGRRGLTGSSMDVAGRAALLANYENQRGAFARQQVINQPAEYERRLGLLGNALNPGLGAGQLASAGFGQQAGLGYQQANQAGANIGGALQNMMYYNALKNAQQNNPGVGIPAGYQAPGPFGAQGNPYIPGVSLPQVGTPPFVSQQPGIGYGIQTSDFFGGG